MYLVHPKSKLNVLYAISHADDTNQTVQIRIISPKEHAVLRFIYDGEVTLDGLTTFVEDWRAGRLRPYHRSHAAGSSRGSFPV